MKIIVLLEQISATLRRHDMLRPGMRLGVAVSGGADSICLLHALHLLSPEWDLSLEVLHLNHHLRPPDSDLEAAFVAETCARLGLPFHRRDLDPRSLPANLEESARRARLDFFHEFLRAGKLDRVATGHTLSDQAETVLFRLLRGAGPGGLSGILPVTAEGLIRPLIDTPRPELAVWLAEQGIAWRDDASNLDPAFTRNRIRHQLLPALSAEYNPRLAEALARFADLAHQDEAEWDARVRDLAAEHLELRPPAVLLRAPLIASLSPALARRLLRHAAAIVRGGLEGLDLHHIDAIRRLAARPEGHGRVIAPRLDTMRSFDWLRLAPPAFASVPFCEHQVAVPGRCAGFEFELIPKDQFNQQDGGALDWDRLGPGLVLRAWRPGDSYQPARESSAQRLKNLFQKARIPFWERRDWPILTWRGEIVWSRRFGPALAFQAAQNTRIALRVTELQT